MPTLLVVDDEPSILLAFRRAYRNTSIIIVTAETAQDGLEKTREFHPDVVVLDVQLPDQSGLDVLRTLQEIDARCPVIFITGKTTTDTAIEAMKLGAYEYLLKPLELPQLRQLIDRALAISRLMHVPAVVAREEAVDDRADAIVGRCAALQEVYKAIGRVAPQDVTVLITGETGTGKELVARAIYQHSRRANGPFLTINCAALPEQLLESELFGHEKGSFTGADRQRIGKFEQCSGGTLFLDEVAELSALAQSKMLRLLQDQEFERVGGNQTVRANVRLLAATNQDLEARVHQGRFRQDLFYRLGVFSIHLPPLRERGDDVTLLVRHYVRRFSREFGKDAQMVSAEALAILERYLWPGNIRELQSVLKQSLLKSAGPVLIPDFLPPLLVAGTDGPGGAGVSSEGTKEETTFVPFPQFIDDQLKRGTDHLYEDTLRRLERLLLTRVLAHTNGNQLQAAKILGITRGSLRTKIRDLGITIGRTIEGGEDRGE